MTQALLLSGGQDSAALLYMLRPSFAITIDYGQRPAEAEIRASSHLCKSLNIDHRVISIDCSTLGSGDMVGSPALPEAPVPEWWPYRNQLLVTMAAAVALTRNCSQLVIGTVKTDSSHADGTAGFVEVLSRLLMMQEGGLDLVAPAIGLTSAELVKKSGIPLELLCWAHSCHVSNLACGQCRGCNKHLEVTHALGFAAF